MSRFEDQSVIVTGAGSGFGEAIAKRFASEGAKVVVSDINQDSGARVTSEIIADGGAALFIPADVSSEADVQALMEGTCEAQDRIDVLVNNAGYSHRQNLTWKITVEEFDAVFAVNVRGVFLGVKHGALAMTESGRGGSIINTASVAGLSGGAGPIAYSAAKAAVINLSKAAAVELAEKKIRVNAICPGPVDTPLLMDFRDDAEEELKAIAEATPMGRIGTPDEIAGAITFLASDDATFITGSALLADGGVTAA